MTGLPVVGQTLVAPILVAPILVAQNGKVVFARGYGLANEEVAVLNTPAVRRMDRPGRQPKLCLIVREPPCYTVVSLATFRRCRLRK